MASQDGYNPAGHPNVSHKDSGNTSVGRVMNQNV